MATAHDAPITLAEVLWPARGMTGGLRVLLLALAGTALLTLSAKLEVPFYPVPMTLQTLAVLVLGMAFGARLATATVLLYLAEGAVGLPVFAGTPERGIGVAYMLGPTGGYLVGFVLAAAVTGWVVERWRSWPALVLAVAAGTVVIYLPGLSWLATFPDPGTGAPMGLERALVVGAAPFLLGDLVKALLAIALGLAGGRVIRRRLEG